MARWLVLVLVAGSACGRIDFAPASIDVAGDGATPDGRSRLDAPGGGGGGADAPLSADGATDSALGPLSSCAMPIILHLGVPVDANTCDTSNSYPLCTPAGTPTHVFQFTAPGNGQYVFSSSAGFPIGMTDSTCTNSETCSAGLSISMTTGQIMTIVIGSGTGGCGPIKVGVN